MRDKDVRLAMRDLLEKTNAFDEVSLKGLPEDWGSRAGSSKISFVEPLNYTQTDLWDGGPNTGSTANNQATITIAVRDSDPQACDEKCELLLQTAIDAIQGQSLANLTVCDHTRFVRAQFQKRVAPERRLVATFAYEYIIDAWDGYEIDET